MKSIAASLLTVAALALPALPALANGAAPAAAAAPAAKADINAGSTKYGAACAACHGADGNSGVPANPKLAQQHPEYLVKQLEEFKSGKRTSPIMQGMAAQLTPADMKNIAHWAASNKAKPGFAKDKDLVILGEKIYRGGIADKQVAACAGCHSPNGAGIPAQYPRLSGQHADYTAAQLTAFRDGVRANSPQMAQIAARLSDKEIKAVADYIAGLR
ncbi:c-type cytochrome [Ramlibacter solisilvae]|uniref:Cytochrome C n=1 Tax=Ramlibacter tataouinensis TaxID=94132 RepID=A0A127JUP5_9BURK|nr:c-type cytochrome [Ramlibacter tataouinensis]AMO23748.1 cytochrome C [Ramlibacter tataouinensis]